MSSSKTLKNGFTMVEVVFVIVVLGILSVGTFVSLKHLYQRVAKSKAMSELSFDSQLVVDQISAMMYDRVPNAVWGYEANQTNRVDRVQIFSIADDRDFKIVEWYGIAVESLRAGDYTGFVDMDNSNKDSSTIKTYGINGSDINNTFEKKFNSIINDSDLALIFAGSFDTGGEVNEYNVSSIGGNNITLQPTPEEIYEKYYLVDSAYAIARGEDTNCSNITNKKDNTLYLFYNYRPWKRDTMCDGNVTTLSDETKGFEVGIVNNSIYFNLSLTREIRGSGNSVTISKQKVVY